MTLAIVGVDVAVEFAVDDDGVVASSVMDGGCEGTSASSSRRICYDFMADVCEKGVQAYIVIGSRRASCILPNSTCVFRLVVISILSYIQ